MRALHRLNRTVRDAAHPETLEQWEARHREFHLTLIAGCRMPVLLSFCGVLLNLNDRYRRSFLRATSGDRDVTVEHSEIAQGPSLATWTSLASGCGSTFTAPARTCAAISTARLRPERSAQPDTFS